MNHRPTRLAVAPLAAPRTSRDGVVIAPSRSIAAGEQSRPIVPIAVWAIAPACWQFRELHRQKQPMMPAVVSIAKRHFGQRNWAVPVRTSLSQSAVEAQFRGIEMTQGSPMRDLGACAPPLEELERLADRVPTDDLRASYFSLGCLRALRAQEFMLFADSFGRASTRIGVGHVDPSGRESVRRQS